MTDGRERNTALGEVEWLYLTGDATPEQSEAVERAAGLDADYARRLKEQKELIDAIDIAADLAQIDPGSLLSIGRAERNAYWKDRFFAVIDQIHATSDRLADSLRNGAAAAVEVTLSASRSLDTALIEPVRECLAPGTRLDLATGGAHVRSDSGATTDEATVVSSRFPGATISVDRINRVVRVDFVDEEAVPQILLVPWANEPPIFPTMEKDESGVFAVFTDVPEGEFLLVVPGQVHE